MLYCLYTKVDCSVFKFFFENALKIDLPCQSLYVLTECKKLAEESGETIFPSRKMSRRGGNFWNFISVTANEGIVAFDLKAFAWMMLIDSDLVNFPRDYSKEKFCKNIECNILFYETIPSEKWQINVYLKSLCVFLYLY